MSNGLFLFFMNSYSGLSQYRIWTSGNDLALENDWRWAVPGNPRMAYFNWSPGMYKRHTEDVSSRLGNTGTFTSFVPLA